MLTLLPPVPTRARFLPSHEPCNPRVDRDRFLQPSVPARGISSALPAESVALSQLLSGPNSSLDSCEAPVRSYSFYYHSAQLLRRGLADGPRRATAPDGERADV
jgi:hypothetical protein